MLVGYCYIELWVALSGVRQAVRYLEERYQVTCRGNIRHLGRRNIPVTTSVADPDHFDTDPDPAFHLIWIRILLWT